MIVTGLGQCSLDYLAEIDSFPENNTKKEVLSWEVQSGGPVATAMVTLSRLGIGCRFHGVVGDDEAGKKIIESLISEKIDVKGMLKRKKSSSQQAFIAIERGSGKRTIFWQRPTGREIAYDELGNDFLRYSNFLHLDGLMGDVSLLAAQEARRMGVPVMLDAGRMRPGMYDLAQICDYVVASEDFAKDLGWNGDYKSLRNTLTLSGNGIITVTLGDRGSVTCIDDETVAIPAFEINVRDTTGAGDVFHGGYIYGLLQGWKIVDTIIFASAMAAMKCEKIGGRTGIPDLKAVQGFLRDRGYPNLS